MIDSFKRYWNSKFAHKVVVISGIEVIIHSFFWVLMGTTDPSIQKNLFFWAVLFFTALLPWKSSRSG